MIKTESPLKSGGLLYFQEDSSEQALLKNLNSNVSSMYTEKHETIVFEAGEYFIREGESADAAYLINQGRVEIFRTTDGGDQMIATLGPGEIVGEMALIAKRKHRSSARALSKTVAMTVTPDLSEEKMRQADSLLKVIVKALTTRLETMDDRLID